jgi:lysophospholipase L1-like esterase
MATMRRRLLSGLGIVTAFTAEILVAQAIAAMRREYATAESAPDVAGYFGDPTDPPLHLMMLGDSTAAGVGVANAEDSVGGHLARFAAAEHRYVQLSGVAVSGSRVGDLGPQVSRALLARPDVAVLLIGANDATHGTSPRQLRPALIGAIRRLRSAGVPVVLGTCPDLGAARAFARPLRYLLAAYGTLIAEVEAEAAGREGAIVIDLAEATGPVFRAEPQATLCSDAFHPSAAGYDLWARALFPGLRKAVAITV